MSVPIARPPSNTGGSSIATALLVCLFFILHLLLLDLPSINWEYAFGEGARYFLDGDPAHLEQYFDHEANTLAIPWLSFAIGRLLPTIALDHIPRLVSALGIPILAYAVLRVNRELAEKTNPCLLVSIVLLNPLVWTFASRGTADFLPAALAMFALALYWSSDRNGRGGIWRILSAGTILGLATVVKYHAILLLAGVTTEIAIRRRAQIGRMFVEWAAATVPALAVLGIYLLAVKIKFGFWLAPPHFVQVHGLNLAVGPDNVVSYAGYLILITVPLSLTIPWRRAMESKSRCAAAILLLAVAFVLGYFFLSDNGEMNLGPLDRYVSKAVANGALAMFAAVLPIRLAVGVTRPLFATRAAELWLGLAATILLFILTLSPTRPAQRYLLFVIPLFYFFLLARPRHHRATIAATILFSIALDGYILLNQAASGVASEEMAQRIGALGLLSSTDPGPIEGNVGNRFFPYRNEPKSFAVVAGDIDDNIAEVRYSVLPGVPFISKSYSLVRLQPQ